MRVAVPPRDRWLRRPDRQPKQKTAARRATKSRAGVTGASSGYEDDVRMSTRSDGSAGFSAPCRRDSFSRRGRAPQPGHDRDLGAFCLALSAWAAARPSTRQQRDILHARRRAPSRPALHRVGDGGEGLEIVLTLKRASLRLARYHETVRVAADIPRTSARVEAIKASAADFSICRPGARQGTLRLLDRDSG